MTIRKNKIDDKGKGKQKHCASSEKAYTNTAKKVKYKFVPHNCFANWKVFRSGENESKQLNFNKVIITHFHLLM